MASLPGAGSEASGYYVDLLERIHCHVVPRTYAEIGIRDGRSLSLALPGTKIVGIDPSFSLHHVVARDARCFTETSDDFFARRRLRDVFGGMPVDLAFIDGMHLFEFAYRDFANLERESGPDSTILVHDCSPPTREIASREQVSHLWAGDVWKLIVCLRRERPDLEVSVVDVAPTGLGIIRSLDPASTLLHDRQEELVERYGALDFEMLEGDRAEVLGLVPDDWAAVRTLLPPGPLRPGNPARLRRRRDLRTAGVKARRKVVRTLKRTRLAARRRRAGSVATPS